MALKKAGKREWFRIPPWIFLGAAVILLPIVTFWTHENLNREKKIITEMMVQKGAALIRSFEAGARTGMMGMMGMRGGEFRLQRLLTETARQQDIAYLIVTDTNGVILAGNDLKKIGALHGNDLDLKKISAEPAVQWREIQGPDRTHIFEVFRRFVPRRATFRRHDRISPRNPPNATRLRENGFPYSSANIIFVGLDMKSVEAARKADALHSIIMAVILLLIGFIGLFLLFLTQAYRTARKTLTRVRAFSDTVVENMPIGLLFINADGRIASFNQAAEDILLISSGEILGHKADALLPRELHSLVEEGTTASTIIEREIDCALRNGTEIPMDVVISPLQGDSAAFLGHIVLFRDLSEIRNLKSEVERSRRLASLGKLAAGIAHEIRNPLSSIKGFATYFKERYREVPADQETADIMIQEVERLNRVIGQLLEFARPVTIQKRPTDVPELLRQSLKLVEEDALQRNIRINLETPPLKNSALVDPDRMKQVLLNLYLNALQAMEEGGTLTIRVRQKETGMVEVVISDTGKGISKEDLEHVFDPYFTRKPSGTGLGLAIAHRIMESHHGEIHIESNPGKGTKVTLSLPTEGDRHERQEQHPGG